jgi:hypothetical protein
LIVPVLARTLARPGFGRRLLLRRWCPRPDGHADHRPSRPANGRPQLPLSATDAAHDLALPRPPWFPPETRHGGTVPTVRSGRWTSGHGGARLRACARRARAQLCVRGEVGAACCVYRGAEPVVDLWGGTTPPPARRPTPIAPCNWWRRRPRGRSRSSPTGWPSAARSTWTRPLRATARVRRRGQGGPARAVAAQPPGGPPRRRASKPLARRRAAGPTRIRSCWVGSCGRARRMRIVESGGDES